MTANIGLLETARNLASPEPMRSVHNDMKHYLTSTDIIDWETPAVLQHAKDLAVEIGRAHV